MRHDGPVTRFFERIGWYDRPLGREELFDLYLDPQEACNRIDDPAYAEVARDLRSRLDQWMERTDDCFRTGRFPEPPGRK